MSDFKITSFTELVYGNSACNGACSQNCSASQKNNTSNNGVYIQDVNGKLWKAEDWDDSTEPNAIAVIADETKFLIALDESSSTMQIDWSYCRPSEESLKEAISDFDAAKEDYDGAGNTENNIGFTPSCTYYAADYCCNFIFPDGKTKGYLPSFGQLYLAYQNKEAIDAALEACGATEMDIDNFYWSSTFFGVNSGCISFWLLYWSNGSVSDEQWNYHGCARPFANF